MHKSVFIILFSLVFYVCSAQQKFKIVNLNNDYETNYIADEQGNILKQVDEKYSTPYIPDELAYFHLFLVKGEDGWSAIDIDENEFFKVHNIEIGMPSPDELHEGKIRIIDENGKIGFGNEKGKVLIKPQFEIATSFHNGKAIIGEGCQKIPWGNHSEEGCQHYTIQCHKHGYINEKGEILKLGNFTFKEIVKEIDWKDGW